METESWIAKGATVAVLQSGTAYDRVTTTTIERLTKTQIVLTNGTRFNRETLRRVGSSNSWHSTRLLPIDDPTVVTSIAHNRSRDAVAHVHKLADDLRNRDDDQKLAVLDKLERAVDAARSAIVAARNTQS